MVGMSYPGALAKIREDSAAETETGLQAIDPLDHDAILDLILDLAARVTCLEKDKALDGSSVRDRLLRPVDPRFHPSFKQ